MHFKLPSLLLICISVANSHCWPNTPLVTSGRWIHNSLGQNVTYAGVNWPGAADVMIPEGLQYASIASIVSSIKSLGMNIIRLTFAIEMIDDIYNNGADVPLLTAFTTALGSTNGSIVYAEVLKHNPTFTSATTRVEVYDAIAAECLKQEIYVHLDNHVSEGEWCCSETDGNAWFGDTYFNVANWKRGLQYMVTRAASWPAFVSIGMRNEPRDPADNPTVEATYNWDTWYTNMVAAATIIHAANPNTLIFFSGLNYDTTLTPIAAATNLGNNVYFTKSSFAFENKIVLELHNYENSVAACSTLESDLVGDGFSALTTTTGNLLPVVVTEWGHDQTDDSYASVYASCLGTYLPAQHVGWMIWVLAGSYYIRSGTQDYDETWGLYNHDWTAWRQAAAISSLETMVRATIG